MATKACARDDVRYAVDATCCPECGETRAYEAGSPEHLVAMVKVRQAKRKPAAKESTVKREPGNEAGK